VDPLERLDWLASHALELGELTSEITDPSPVSAYLAAEDLWIGSQDFGLLRTDKTTRDIELVPIAAIDEAEFLDTFVTAWIPQIQQFWGRQVLHASTVFKTGNHGLVAFSGDKESGKSTLAFGLAQRQSWKQLGDDMLVFEVSEGSVAIIPYDETPRLRPTSAAYFGIDATAATAPEASEWPEADLSARLIYTLAHTKDLDEPIRITRLSGADAYTPLLRQAFNLSLKLPDLNRRLIEDYAALANEAQVFLLEYCQEIDLLPRILDEIEAHASEI
jgi:hypothetical protein